MNKSDYQETSYFEADVLNHSTSTGNGKVSFSQK